MNIAKTLLLNTALTTISVSEGGVSLSTALLRLVSDASGDATVAGIVSPAFDSVIQLGRGLIDSATRAELSGNNVICGLVGGFTAAKLTKSFGLTGSQSWQLSSGISHMSESALHAARESIQMLNISNASDVTRVTPQPPEFVSLLKSYEGPVATDGLLTVFRTMIS